MTAIAYEPRPRATCAATQDCCTLCGTCRQNASAYTKTPLHDVASLLHMISATAPLRHPVRGAAKCTRLLVVGRNVVRDTAAETIAHSSKVVLDPMGCPNKGFFLARFEPVAPRFGPQKPLKHFHVVDLAQQGGAVQQM